MMENKLALQLYKYYNTCNYDLDWVDLNIQQNFNNRWEFLNYFKSRIGKNKIINRFGLINNKIIYDWFNENLILRVAS